MRLDNALGARIQRIVEQKGLARTGRRLVVEGILSFRGFPDAKVDLFADWTVNPFGNRGWQWNTSSFNFMPALIAYHQQSNDEAAIDFAVRAVESWISAFPQLKSGYEFANHDHAAALRAENVVLLLGYLVGRGLRTDSLASLEKLVLFEASRLELDRFYSRHTNHGVAQARVLALIANVMPEDDRSEQWWALAIARLIDELEFAFTPEGVHVENSPGYHVVVCNEFASILAALPADRVELLAQRLDQLMPKAMTFLAHITRPDGLLPIIGDSQLTSPVDCFGHYRSRPEYHHLRFSLSRGEQGEAPPHSVVAFPGAGYAVIRDRWSRDSDFTDTFHMVIKCGWHSAYHRHDDDLNLILYCGEDWLIDGGMYCYQEADPTRRYLRSKWAHNVPVVEPLEGEVDCSFSPSQPHEARLEVLGPMEPTVRLKTTTAGYPGYLATRNVVVEPARRAFDISDRLVPVAPGGRMLFRSLWHVPADKDVYVRGQDVLVASPRSGRALRISGQGEVFDHVGVGMLRLPKVSTPMVSWRANQVEPCKLISFERSGSQFSSELTFELLDVTDTSGWTLRDAAILEAAS